MSFVNLGFQKFAPKGIKPWTIAPAFGLAEHTLIVTGRANWQSRPNVLYVDAKMLQAERTVKVYTAEEAASMGTGEFQDLVSCGSPFKGVTGKSVAACIHTRSKASGNKALLSVFGLMQ